MPSTILKFSARDSTCFEDSNKVKDTPRTRMNSLLLKSENLLRLPFSHDDESEYRRKSITRATGNSRFRPSSIYEIITPRPSLPVTSEFCLRSLST
ncbi:hypothetical protein Moror_6268 [Moniliophthora roreri MCA 2997]|uniref:Uncharacterized protein n=1 Tax=Moniliophthora roreri (strain MCA 2997) TaxID=1381753 RepID=V2XXD9_MONRO|nr:hypothetical protein Moror_6268 [Moniliophthora roreri MCA 2997]